MRLVLENFRNFPSLDISLPERGVVAIAGESGSGKSTILDAIHFALFGSKTNIYPKDSQEGTRTFVKVRFDPSCPIYEIYRQKRPGLLIVKKRGQNDKKFLGDQAQGIIIEEFGDEGVWLMSSYISQGRDHRLMGISHNERMDVISKLALGKDISEGALLDKVRGKYKEEEAQFDESKMRYKIAQREVERYGTGYHYEGNREKDEERLKEIPVMKERERNREISLLAERSRAIEKNKMRKERLNVNVTPSQIDDLERILEAERAELEVLKESRDMAHEYERLLEVPSPVVEIEREISEMEVRDQIMRALNRANEEYTEASEIPEPIGGCTEDELESLLGAIGERDLIDMENTLVEAERWEDWDRRVKLEREIREGDEESKSIAQVVTVRDIDCPKCNERLMLHRGELCHRGEGIMNTEISSDLDSRFSLYCRGVMAKRELDGMEDIEEPSSNRPNNIPERGEIERQREMRDRLNELGIKSPREELQRRRAKKKREDLAGDRGRYQEELSKKIEMERRGAGTAVQERERLNAKRRRNELEGKCGTYVRGSVEALYGRIKEEEKRLGKLSSELKISEALREMGETRSLGEIDRDISCARGCLREMAKEEEDIREREERRDKAEEEQRRLKEVEASRRGAMRIHERLCAYNDIKVAIVSATCEMVDGYLAKLNEETNACLEELFDEPMSVSLKSFKDVKSQDRIKPQINVEIAHRGGIFSRFSILSGGERARLSAALLVAFSKCGSSRISILDETMASLDGDNRSAVIEYLRRTIGKESLILIVNHDGADGDYDHIVRIP